VATPSVLTRCEIVRAEIAKYPDWDVDIMTAIAKAESECNTNTTGDKQLVYQQAGRTYGYSVSVLQVRILQGREHCDSHDLAINIKCAYEVWQKQGYKAWTMYNNLKYRRFL